MDIVNSVQQEAFVKAGFAAHRFQDIGQGGNGHFSPIEPDHARG